MTEKRIFAMDFLIKKIAQFLSLAPPELRVGLAKEEEHDRGGKEEGETPREKDEEEREEEEEEIRSPASRCCRCRRARVWRETVFSSSSSSLS